MEDRPLIPGVQNPTAYQLASSFLPALYDDAFMTAEPTIPARTPRKPKTPRLSRKADEPDDFGYYVAIELERLSATERRIHESKAAQSNPKGVKVIKVTEESKEQMAGYLFFKDTAQLTRFMRGPLKEIVIEWYNNRHLGFDLPCTKVQNADPSTYKWTLIRMFEIIEGLTDDNIAMIQSKSVLTHADLGINDTMRDEPGYFCWIATMERVMAAYSEHFPGDDETTGKHTPENWHRAFLLLRCFWREMQRNGDVGPGKYILRKTALAPRFLRSGSIVDDEDANENSCYSLDQLRRNNDDLAQANMLQTVSDTDSDAPDRADEEDMNYDELEEFHKTLCPKGDIWRAAQKATTSRPGLTQSQLNEYFEDLYLRVGTKIYKVNVAKNVTDNQLLHQSAQEQEKLDSMAGLPKDELLDSDAERQKFFDINNMMSSASAKPPSFLQACTLTGVDPKKLIVNGAPNLKPYPHQIIDVAWLGLMEQSAIKAAILAGECGSGKTITILIHLLIQAIKAEKAGSTNHKVSVIFAPSSVVDVWYSDWKKFFSQSLICKMFYGKGDTSDPDRDACVIPGTTAEDLDKFLEDCRDDDPKTSRTFILTSYTTWVYRCLTKKKVQPEDPTELNGEVFDALDEEGKLEEFRLAIKNKHKIGRVVCDEAHLIKNPKTFAADSILRIKAEFFLGVSATPLINRITDMRGYLCQIAKGRHLGFNLPNDLSALLSIYKPGFDPRKDLPTNNIGEPYTPLLQPPDKSYTSEMVHNAVRKGYPIHILCPAAYLAIGNKSKWNANVARDVLRPILNLIQMKRLLSRAFETEPGVMVRPGEGIPHYTVTTIELQMSVNEQHQYDNLTLEWRRKLNLGEEEANSMLTKVKQGNEVAHGSLNNDAFRGLMVSSFDLQLGRYLRTNRKYIPIATSQEVFHWSKLDEDHGVSFKFKKCRPRGAHYIPPPSNRVDAASVHMAESVKQQAMVAQMARWKKDGKRALIYFNWPISQW
ncbi:hypothetical protein NHQ30_011071 [Ciborinia camelliae]|nr:hypothetical protein NHQ30_011071 [Ciborinia camelliae]